jgi:hypothetical protein
MKDKIYNNKNILKDRNLIKREKRGFKMAIGEYAGFLTFGILSTGALAYRPTDLPLLILGAFVFSLIFMKFTNWSFYNISKTRINFVIFSIIAGIIASIGILISTKTGIIIKINGTLWLFMAVSIMKYNLDYLLE